MLIENFQNKFSLETSTVQNWFWKQFESAYTPRRLNKINDKHRRKVKINYLVCMVWTNCKWRRLSSCRKMKKVWNKTYPLDCSWQCLCVGRQWDRRELGMRRRKLCVIVDRSWSDCRSCCWCSRGSRSSVVWESPLQHCKKGLRINQNGIN